MAAIIVVAYNGIQGRAVAASLTSDLISASTKLKLYQVDNSSYPTSITDCPNPAVGNTCLKNSSNNTYTDFQVDNSTNPQAVCLTARNTNGTQYRITNDGTPSVGSCSAASCLAILTAGESTGDGVYWIKPAAGAAFQARCDMTTDGGGWTLVGKGREGWNWTNAGQGTLSDIATNPIGNGVSFMPSVTITSIINKNVNSLTDGVRLYRFGTNQDWRINFSTMTSWDWNMDTSFADNVTGRSPVCTGTLAGNSTDGNYCAATNDCDRIFTWAWSGHNYTRGWSSGQSCSCTAYGLYGWCYAGEGHVILMSQVWVRH